MPLTGAHGFNFKRLAGDEETFKTIRGRIVSMLEDELHTGD